MKLTRKAFTLVELIIVIAIIAVLAVSAFMVLTKWLGKSRDSRRLSDIGAIERSMMTWMSDIDANGKGTINPASVTALVTGNIVQAGSGTTSNYAFNKTFMDGLATTDGEFDVFQKELADPSNKSKYYKIGIDSTKKLFSVAATLENDGSSYKAAVRGNWSPDTKVGTDKIYSLVLDKSKTTTDNGSNFVEADFVKDEGTVLPYSIQ